MEQSGTTRQEEMFSQIEAWQTSGKTQVEFCRDRQISYHTFHYWLAKYSRRSAEPQSGLFTRIHLSTQPAKPGFIELIFPDGRRLVFHQAVEAGFLRSLLA
jgi:hypothetical protein